MADNTMNEQLELEGGAAGAVEVAAAAGVAVSTAPAEATEPAESTAPAEAAGAAESTDAVPQVKPPLTRPVSPELGKKTPFTGRNKKTTAVAVVCIVIAVIWAAIMIAGSVATLHKINKDDEPLVISASAEDSAVLGGGEEVMTEGTQE